jgi:hypothetical protein
VASCPPVSASITASVPAVLTDCSYYCFFYCPTVPQYCPLCPHNFPCPVLRTGGPHSVLLRRDRVSAPVQCSAVQCSAVQCSAVPLLHLRSLGHMIHNYPPLRPRGRGDTSQCSAVQCSAV